MNSKILGDLYLRSVKRNGPFDFSASSIYGEILIYLVEETGVLRFRGTTFHNIQSQEAACLKARITFDQTGDRESADYYFYREMEAKRRQKHFGARILESPVQYLLGYGTKWGRVILLWICVVLACALFYWAFEAVEAAGSFWENLYFSIVTATTLGYGDYHPKAGVGQLVASLEAIFGTFAWAAFITVFARKYMR